LLQVASAGLFVVRIDCECNTFVLEGIAHCVGISVSAQEEDPEILMDLDDLSSGCVVLVAFCDDHFSFVVEVVF